MKLLNARSCTRTHTHTHLLFSLVFFFSLFFVGDVRSQCTDDFILEYETDANPLLLSPCDVFKGKVTITYYCQEESVPVNIVLSINLGGAFEVESTELDINNGNGSISGYQTGFITIPASDDGIEPTIITYDIIFRSTYVEADGFPISYVTAIDIYNENLDILDFASVQGAISPVRIAESGNLSDMVSAPSTTSLVLFPLQNNSNSYSYPFPVIIDGELVVDIEGDYYIRKQGNNNIQFGMTPDSKIIIQSGSHLHLHGINIKGCESMWGSIIVEDGAELTISNCYILDGTQAIKVEGGGKVTMTGNVFENNFISLDIRNSVPGQEPSATADIRQNEFRGVGTLKAPFENQRPISGIIAVNIPNLEIPHYGGTSNIFKNMRSGIRCRETNLAVDRARFSDITRGSNNAGGDAIFSTGLSNNIDVRGATFNRCFNGINASGSNLAIFDNLMEDMNFGIRTRNSFGKIQEIIDNEIYAANTGLLLEGIQPIYLYANNNSIRMNNPTDAVNSFGIRANLAAFNPGFIWSLENNQVYLEDAKNGIEITSGTRIDVRDNAVLTSPTTTLLERYVLIELNGTQSPFLTCNSTFGNVISTSPDQPDNYKASVGISLNGTPGGNIHCNSVSNSDLGIDVNDMSMDLQIRGNQFQNHRTGLQLRENANIGAQYQGTSYNGNEWSSLNSVDDPNPNDDKIGAEHLSDNTFIQGQSLFIVDNSSNNAMMPSLSSTGSNDEWFVSFTGTNFACPTASCGFDPNAFIVEEDDRLKKNIMKNELASEGFNAALRYAGARQLYRGLGNVQINSGGSFDDFLTTEGSTTVGGFNVIENDITNLFAINTVQQDNLSQYWETIKNATASIWIKEDSLSETSSIATIELLTSEIIALREEKLMAQEAYQTLSKQLGNAKQQAIVQVLADNETVNAQEIYEVNQKTVNDLLLKTWAVGIEPDSTQLVALKTIANQCPLAGGEAVYHARALVKGDENYDDEALCSAAAQNSEMEEKAESATSFSIYPNPSAGKFNLILPEGVRFISITNSMGQEVKRWDNISFTNLWNMPKLDLEAGIYYCTVETESNRETQSIVIVK